MWGDSSCVSVGKCLKINKNSWPAAEKCCARQTHCPLRTLTLFIASNTIIKRRAIIRDLWRNKSFHQNGKVFILRSDFGTRIKLQYIWAESWDFGPEMWRLPELPSVGALIGSYSSRCNCDIFKKLEAPNSNERQMAAAKSLAHLAGVAHSTWSEALTWAWYVDAGHTSTRSTDDFLWLVTPKCHHQGLWHRLQWPSHRFFFCLKK